MHTQYVINRLVVYSRTICIPFSAIPTHWTPTLQARIWLSTKWRDWVTENYAIVSQRRNTRGDKRLMRRIPVHTTSESKNKEESARDYNYVEVSRVWYSLPSFLLSNVTSFTNNMDELIVTVETTRLDIVTITKAWQHPKLSTFSPPQDKQKRGRSGIGLSHCPQSRILQCWRSCRSGFFVFVALLSRPLIEFKRVKSRGYTPIHPPTHTHTHKLFVSLILLL